MKAPARQRTLPAAVALCLTIVLLPGCAFLDQFLGSVLQKPTLTFQNAKVRDLSFQGLGLDLTWQVDNPNDFGVNLASIGYDLKIDGKQFTSGTADKGIKIAPAGRSPVTLPFNVKFQELGGALLALYQKDQVPYEVGGHFGFNTPMGVIKLPFKRTGILPVPKLPTVRIAGARLGSLTLTGARLDVQVEVGNKNTFQLPIRGLNYGLTLNGKNVATGNASVPVITAGGRRVITLPVNLNFASAGRAVYDAIRTKRVKLGLTGALDTGPIKLPLNLSQDVSL